LAKSPALSRDGFPTAMLLVVVASFLVLENGTFRDASAARIDLLGASAERGKRHQLTVVDQCVDTALNEFDRAPPLGFVYFVFEPWPGFKLGA
jgi:hypothetical protein